MQSQAQQTSSMRSHTAVPTASSIVVRSCASNPCLNGGLCLDHPNGFVCRCQAPWAGRICNSYQGTAATFTRSIVKRQASGECSATTCKNGGTCYFFNPDVVCVCAWPWGGDDCTEYVGPNPSVSTNSPRQTTAPFVTTARPATTMMMQTTARPATTMVMQTTARPATTMVMQTTARPVTGISTTSSYTSCTQSPCRNGGTCVPRGDSYSCFCGLKSIYSGKNCDSTAPLSKQECPLNCAPAQCVFSGYAERPYACLWNGIMRPATGTTA